jgi:hypothetical protein
MGGATMTARVLVLPLPPNLANGRQHWRVKLAAKQRYYEAARLALLAQVGAVQTMEPPHVMRVEPTLYLHQGMDHDNAAARCKWILDSLVGHGLLYADSPRWCDLVMPRQVMDRKHQRVELTLTEVASEGAGT